VLALIGVLIVKVVATGAYLNYVQQWVRLPLLASGAVLVVISFADMLRRDGDTDDHEDHSSHSAWLLIIPVVVITLISPKPLGSFVAERRANDLPPPSTTTMKPLPGGDPLSLQVVEFVLRARYDGADSLAGRSVKLSGFVSYGDDDAWYVTRIAITCCAADGIPYRVRVLGPPRPSRDTWIEVTGVWKQDGTRAPRSSMPELTALEIRPIGQPGNPYE
jgi:uncharacterized repeat protein (TIGR03943 family)